jgi:signal transduction histidine kinase/ActR/RegA family two-component response regulator
MQFRDTPIRRQLMAINLATIGVALLLTYAGFLAYEFLTFRQAAARQLSTLGEIIATNSTAALAFDNQNDAAEILAALKAERHIVAACLYDREGRPFARYPDDAPGAAFPATPGGDGYRFEGGDLVGFAPVVQVKGRQRLGTLYLRSDMEAMYDRLRLYGLIAALVGGFSSFVAYTLSRKLQQRITGPILALAETAQAVSDRRDYSVRAARLGGGELGLLTEAFNHMLGQIEEQNLALQRAYDDLRQTQQAITQQERLRALGQMASGIAHDINNAISPASLYAESLLEREPNLSPRTRDYLTTIQRAIDDVAQTVSRLREFYRQREPQLALTPVDLNALARQVADLTRARWGDMSQQRGVMIDMKLALAPALPVILGVESELREALTNLVFNAVDALPEGGTITLATRLTAEQAREGRPVSAPYVAIEVADSGVGMDEETKRRCLEPFFTTKGDRGTGLGLAMVYGTMRRHGAEIEVASAAGHGTTMRLLFPLPATAVEPVAPASAAPMLASRLRLLVVDDDAVLLKSLTETLEDDGHEVVAAGGGQAGIDAFAAAHGTARAFAAVITDLGMPHVDGRRVAGAIKSLSPATPVFLLTGWGQRMVAEGHLPPQVDRVLNKPPKLRELREALASVPAPRA